MVKLKRIRIKTVLKILLITFFLLQLASAKFDSVFNILGVRTYVVLSGSMEPKFYPGDVVVVVNKNKTDLNIDDIITFKLEEDVITHRIMEKTENGYITKGDNNNIIDSDVVSYDNVIGKVMFSIPKIGYVIDFVSKPIVMSFIMILLGFIILIQNMKE